MLAIWYCWIVLILDQKDELHMNQSYKQVIYPDFHTYAISNIMCVSALLFDKFSIIKHITKCCNSDGNIRLNHLALKHFAMLY